MVSAGAWSAAQAQQEVTGAGATFQHRCMPNGQRITTKLQALKSITNPVGSGAGLRQIDAKTVAFGASDMPLKEEELEKKGLTQFPMVIGGVVPVINVKGIAPGQLKLTGQILGDIYLGKITKWNDPAIKRSMRDWPCLMR